VNNSKTLIEKGTISILSRICWRTYSADVSISNLQFQCSLKYSDAFTNKIYQRINIVYNALFINDMSSYFSVFFSFVFSWYIHMEYFCRCLPMEIVREYPVSKIHCNLPTEIFYQYFYLYLSMF
jgi:hypothetical protein